MFIPQGFSVLLQWIIEFTPVVSLVLQKQREKSLLDVETFQTLREELKPLFGFNSSEILQEKLLQQELAHKQRETELEIARQQREMTLKLPEINKILENWPLRLYPSQLLESHHSSSHLPLKILFAPPQIDFDESQDTKEKLPHLELRLAEQLRDFLSQYYSLHNGIRSTEFIAGAWESKRFHSESSIKALFSFLKSEPTLILESQLEGNYITFRVAYWGIGQNHYYYKTVTKFPYKEILQDSAKQRSREWRETRNKLLELGERLEDVEKIGGWKEKNLQLLEKEEKWLARGIDIKPLELNYHIEDQDSQLLCQFLGDCHCLVAGWIADIYHLIYRDTPPFLPSILPQLIHHYSDQQLIENLIKSYQQIYHILEQDRPYWIPELSLQLAQSLAHLPSKKWAEEQLKESIIAWCRLRHLPIENNYLQSLKTYVTQQDADYIQQLKACYLMLNQGQIVNLLEEILQNLPQLSPQSPTLVISQKNLEPLYTLSGHIGKVSSVAIDPEGKLVVSGGMDKTIRIWQLKNGELLRTLNGHSAEVSSVAISPDGKYLASSSLYCPKSNVKVWNLQNGRLLHSRLGHKKSVKFVTFDRESKLLVTGGNKVKLWNVESGIRLKTLWHSCPVNTAMMSWDGELLICGGEDGKIKFWHWQTGELIYSINADHYPITALKVTDNREYLITGDTQGLIKIWHIPTGKLERSLQGHSQDINTLLFAHQGKCLISASNDGTINIWQWQIGDLLHSLTSHCDGVNSIDISANQKYLVSGSSDQTLKVWQLTF